MRPTSATGGNGPKRRREAGFTLVELIITLSVVALAATAVVLALPESRPSLAEEAERLAARLLKAQEAAIVENRPYAATIDFNGYRFERRTLRGWETAQASGVRDAAWEQGTSPTLEDARAIRIQFDPIGAADPMVIRLARGAEAARVLVSETGESEVASHAPRP